MSPRVEPTGHTVEVRGPSLAGRAAAARLAHVGHRVVLVTDTASPGRTSGRVLGGATVDDLPLTTTLPAAWRDLVKKTGRAFAPTMHRARLDLVEPTPATHRFASGREVTLPCDRAGQIHAWQQGIGRPAALRWAELVDDVDRLWQALRRHGTERPLNTPLSPADRKALWAEVTVDDLCGRLDHPDLAAWLRSTAVLTGAGPNGSAPALLATRCTLERTFGRWVVVDAESRLPLPLSTLVAVLEARLQERGVHVTDASDEAPDAVIEALPPTPPAPGRRWWGGRRPAITGAWTPKVHHDLVDAAAASGEPQLLEVVDHTRGAPVVTWTRPTHDGAVRTTHDWVQASPDPAAGWSMSCFEHWASRPQLGGEGRWHASAASPAGNEPWAELLSGALVAYEVHDELTGADIRPTNPDNVDHRTKLAGL